MDNHKDNEILLATRSMIEFNIEPVKMVKIDNKLLNCIYRAFSEAVGTDMGMEICRLFKGQQVTFPVRFSIPSASNARSSKNTMAQILVL